MKRIFMLGLLGLAALGAWAQDVSKKQEITLFGISTGKADMDRGVVSSVDARIKEVFVNLGRFEVLGLTYRMEGLTPDEFVNKIWMYKEENKTIPTEFAVGDKVFTRAEYLKVMGSFLLIIPQVNNYFVADKGRQWEANIDMSITIIDVETGKAIQGGQINMVKKGQDKDPNAATQRAIDQIVSELTYKVRSVDQFKIKSGIVEVRPFGEVVIELGMDMGIQPGDEYAVAKVNGSGKYATKDDQGLMVIKNVQDKFSIGTMLYGDAKMTDSVTEIPRQGLDVDIYGLYLLRTLFESGLNKSSTQGFLLGIRGTGTRGFYDTRPWVALEVPFNELGEFGGAAIPFNAWVGGEYQQYIGRLSLSGSVGLGISGAYIWLIDALNDALGIKADSAVLYTGFGLRGNLRADFLISRDFKIRVEGDARVMISPLSGFLGSHTAYGAGAAAIFKL